MSWIDMEHIFKEMMSVEDLSVLKGVAFERYLSGLFTDLGYRVEETPPSGDYGADLILFKSGIKIVVQAKQYSSPVGFDAVKEAHFARSYYSAGEAWVIATHGFTPQAVSAASSADVRLIDGPELVVLAARARDKERRFSNSVKDQDLPSCISDSLFWDALRVAVEENDGSSVAIQRGLKVSMQKASRLSSLLGEAGVVGRPDMSGLRPVMMSQEELTQLFDLYYDPLSAKTREMFNDEVPVDIFSGDDRDHAILVECPGSLPAFYLLESGCGFAGGWRCIGIDVVDDYDDAAGWQRRRSRVAQLKLMSPLCRSFYCGGMLPQFGESYGTELLDIYTAYQAVKKGEKKVVKPGWGKRERQDRDKAFSAKREKEKEEASLREKERLDWERERHNKEAGCLSVVVLILLILLLVASLL